MELPIQAIRSRQNARVKEWRRSIESQQHSLNPLLAVEGIKQIRDAARFQSIELLLFSHPSPAVEALADGSAEVVRLSRGVLKSLSSVRSSQQVIAFFRKPSWEWHEIGPFVLYLHELQDPGNLGTLLRTAWATGSGSVIGSPGTVSVFNPKVVRASASALFRVPFFQDVELDRLRERNYRIAAAVPGSGQTLFEVPLVPPMAFVVGSEGSGLPKSLLRRTDVEVQIPMQPGCDSLNAGVAGSLVLYEFYRRGMS